MVITVHRLENHDALVCKLAIAMKEAKIPLSPPNQTLTSKRKITN